MAYLTPAEVRDRVPTLADTTEFPDDELVRNVAGFEEIAEEYLGAAYSARTVTQTFDYPGSTVMLDGFPVQSVTSVTADGTALAAGSGYRIDRESGIITLLGVSAVALLTVVYVHAKTTTTPETLLRACAEYVRAVCNSDRSPQGRDVIVETTASGVSTRYGTANREQRRPTGFAEVDRLLNDMPNSSLGHAVG